jgi:hypothetical protein
MKKVNWIPKKDDLVMWQGKKVRIVSVDMGGKCRVRTFAFTVDVSELSPVT